MDVRVVDHPLAAARLTTLRDERTGNAAFRAALRDLTHMLVYEATRDEGVAFLGINVRDNDIDAPRDFIADRGITFPSIYDPAMRTMIAFGGKYPTTVIPSTLVLDRRHRVAAVFLRELLDEDLIPLLQRLAAEPAPKFS